MPKEGKKKNIKKMLNIMSGKGLERMQKKSIQHCADENDELKSVEVNIVL